MKKFILLASVAVVLFPTLSPLTAQQKAPFVVIVHPDVPTEEVSKKRVSQLLLKESLRWDGGLSAQPVDLDSKSPVRDAFSRQVHGRSVSSIKNYWLRKIFSGDGEPPPEVPSDAAAINFVKTHPGAIGYVSSQARLDGVKVLSLDSN